MARFAQPVPAPLRVFEFAVLDPPTPMGRKRGAFKGGNGSVFYPEKKDVRSVYHIRQAFIAEYPEMTPPEDPMVQDSRPLITGACRLYVNCFFKAPTMSLKKRRLAWMHPYVMNTKPDLNNVINQICDALTGYCYVDDKLVRLGRCDKFYALNRFGEPTPPHMQIKVEEC